MRLAALMVVGDGARTAPRARPLRACRCRNIAVELISCRGQCAIMTVVAAGATTALYDKAGLLQCATGAIHWQYRRQLAQRYTQFFETHRSGAASYQKVRACLCSARAIVCLPQPHPLRVAAGSKRCALRQLGQGEAAQGCAARCMLLRMGMLRELACMSCTQFHSAT